MIETRWVCDRCGKEGVNSDPPLTVFFWFRDNDPEKHLCGDCVQALAVWIDLKGAQGDG